MNSIFSKIELRKRAGIMGISFGFRGVFFFAALMLIICGLVGSVWAADGSSVISNIALTDNSIQVKIQGPIKYSIQKPADPFSVVVEFEGTSIGNFNGKIVSTIPGITEIIPTQVETPTIAARLTILLQSPSEIKGEVKDDTLVLTLGKASDTALPSIKEEPAGKNKDGMARYITDVAFDKDGDTLELIIKADGRLAEPSVFQLEGQVMLEIPGVSMKAAMPAKVPPQVKDIKVKAEQERLKFTLTLADKTNSEVYILDDEVVVDILSKEKKTAKPVAEKDMNIQEKVANGSKVISLDFQDADIVPILRLLGDVGGYNMVVHPDVKGKITMKLMNVPWNQAMDIILKTFNLEKVVEGNIIRIATVKAFQDEKKAVAENKELFGKAEDIETKVFMVNYANVDDITEHDEITKQDRKIPGIKDLIEKGKILSPRGTISFDSRTRTVIVKDIPASIEEVRRLLEVLDKPTKQVLIEARIVEMNNDYVKSLGVEWGLTGKSSQMFARQDGRYQIAGSTGSSVSGGSAGNTEVVNLPAATSTITSPTSAITFGFLNMAQSFGLDLRISAIADSGNAKIVSSPKVLTLDNRSAVIKQGQKIPVTTQQLSGGTATYTTTYIDALLKLTVTPQIAPDGSIQLRVEVNKDAPDFTNKDILGNPVINVKQALTQVMLNDGETIVIGGILTSNENSDDNEVPGLGKIPGLGWLFKKRTNEKHTTELLIFITPRLAQQ
ncbi:MAG TPA: type IV pilus secretin PilQ [Dissulfurispiraceae bacterium]|nr:type IV pilus secretin PilQ [Dissulfurispiraceae bacterium]